jgi:hypothetical protein
VTVTFLAACIGSLLPIAGIGYDWVLTYADGIVVERATTEPKLCELRTSRRFTYHVCTGSVCSDESGEVCSDQLPGDVDCTGSVGTSDFNAVRTHFGEVAP